MTRLKDLLSRIRTERDARLIAAVAAILVIGVTLAAVAWSIGRGSQGGGDEPAVHISPTGDDVPRLTPIVVTFAKVPGVTDGATLLSVEPATSGTYAWLSERTLLFQPDYPGLARGEEYQVVVHAQQAGLERDWRSSFVTAGELRVETVIPADGDTEIPADAQVLIQFSRAVAPLTTLSALPTGNVVEFEPPLEGTGEWLNTSLYRFVPRAFPPNTTFHVRIPAGLTSAADGELQEDFRWSFATYGPAVNSFEPAPGTEMADIRTGVTVRFNQPMDRASAEGSFQLAGPGGSRVAGGFAWSDSTTMVFQPSAPLGRQTSYVATLAAGVRGANGGATSVTFTSAFTTVPPPGVIQVQPGIDQQNAPRYGIHVRFATPVNPNTVEGTISVSGLSDADLYVDVSYWDERDLYLNAQLKASTDYTVTIRAGIVDRYGDAVPPFSWSFRTSPLASFVSYVTPSWYGTYGASTEPVLYFHAANVSEAGFTLWRLTPEEAASVRHAPPGNYDRDDRWTPSQPPIRQWQQPVVGNLDEVILGSTSLSGGGPLPRGDYYVRTATGYRTQLVFSVVDTAIVTKETFDALLTWVVDLDSGDPVAGALVEVEGPYLTGSNSAVSDGNGLTSFPLLKPYDRSEQRTTASYIVTVDSGGRHGVHSTAWSRTTDLWSKGIYYSVYDPARKYVGQVYPDRPLYRPGEEVFLRGVVRLDDDAAYTIPPGDVPFTVSILDPEGTELVNKTVQVNEFGSFAASLVLGEAAPTGDYSVVVKDPASPTAEQWRYLPAVASNVFMVAEFRKPEFEVSAAADRPAFANGETAVIGVDASYYFGGAVSGATVEWSGTSLPQPVRIPGFDRFSFSDFDPYANGVSYRGYTDPSGAAKTGDDGRASVSIPALLPDGRTSQLYTVGVTVTDASNQAVAGSASFWVHPATKLAGIRAESYVARVGEEIRYEVAAVDLANNPLPSTPITVKVYDRRWVTSKQRTVEGGYLYKSEPVDELLDTLSVTAGPGGRAFVTYTAAKPGTLRVVAEVTDEAGRRARGATNTWLWGGDGFAAWRVTNDDLIDLVADRDSYKVGDTARVLVPVPFPGATGLLSVERARVQSAEVRRFATSAETIEIPVLDRAVPNVYVSVVLYRPPTAEDPVPRYKFGVVKLPVSTDVRELSVDVTPDRTRAQPGETVEYTIQVRDHAGRGVQAELSVAVVDKALLALQDERGPDGLAAFWFERGLGVLTESSLGVSVDRANDSIKEYSEGGKGGGGLDDPRLREDFRNLALWEAQLKTDAGGRAVVQVKLPDNLTTWHLQARAVTVNGPQVGEGQAEVMTTQPLLLRPALPRFLRVGDTSSLRLVITNGTADAADVRVAIEAEGLELADASEKVATVAGDSSAVLEWPVAVTSPGRAKVTFGARSTTGTADAVALEFPIQFDLTPEATATGGVVRDRPMVEAIFLPQFAIVANGSLEVSVQRTLTGTLSGDLSLFPYHDWPEGTDYVASRLLATLAVERAERSAGMDVSGHERAITRDLADLYSRRRAGGGLAWCTSYLCPASEEATAIALIAFGEAKRNGHAVDGVAVTGAQSFLSGSVAPSGAFQQSPTPMNTPDALSLPDGLSKPASSSLPTPAARNPVAPLVPVDPNRNAYYLYALSVAGNPIVRESQVRALVEQRRGELTNAGRSYLLLAMAEASVSASDPLATRLLNDLTASVVPSANGNVFSDPQVSDQVSTALAAAAILRLQPKHPLLEETIRWLMAARRDPYTWHVQNARLILALADYAVSTGELAGEYEYTVRLKDETLLDGQFRKSDGPQLQTATVPLERLGAGTVSLVTLLRDFGKNGRLYYTMALRYLTPAKDVESLNRGIAVAHEYTLLEDPATRIGAARVGSIVRVKVTVMTAVDRHEVRVDDLLPAGLEPIDPRLRTTDPNLVTLLEEERRAAAAVTGGRGGYMAPWCRWYYSPWDAAELRDDRLTLRASYLPRGVHEYVYYARATLAGDYFVAPAVAQEAFFPEVFGRSDSGRFVVGP